MKYSYIYYDRYMPGTFLYNNPLRGGIEEMYGYIIFTYNCNTAYESNVAFAKETGIEYSKIIHKVGCVVEVI